MDCSKRALASVSHLPGLRSFPRVSHVTVPKGYPRVAHPQNLSTGAFPTATFSQNFLAVPNKPGVPKPVSWSPPQAPSSDVIGEMREAVKSTDWWQLYLDKKTKTGTQWLVQLSSHPALPKSDGPLVR
eukprot:g16590.t1